MVLPSKQIHQQIMIRNVIQCLHKTISSRNLLPKTNLKKTLESQRQNSPSPKDQTILWNGKKIETVLYFLTFVQR